ncbi:Quinol monooxygenase YgiN [Catalinimonas alkaloidigena]|uniref:Quinol monooxygenase YgiN n=1 Tax=Catalinimonas alkaloidigena TaxID=1075417 RepID=A0A1G9DDG4_9BACT|nr:antibiotic biosynthesis monooxygenase family protein [Catalinimonas alkaloidigena]SDK61905.1 Quinol monooxygenase YgiN [Catalinimonas alkaloidigena]
MVIRIVRLVFREDSVEEFLRIFQRTSPHIRHFEGCQHLELLHDCTHPHVYYTYSYWESEAALEQYRHSPLFKQTWAETRQLFGGRPSAHSVQRVTQVT